MRVYRYINKKTGKPNEPFGVCGDCNKKKIPVPPMYKLELLAREGRFPCRYCLEGKVEVTAGGKVWG